MVFKKLQNLDKNLDGKISTAAEENGQESTSDEEKWIIGVHRTLEEAKTSLKLCDMAGAVAKNGLDLLSKAGNARKGDVLTKWQDALQQNMKTALDTGRATDAILAKALECLEEAKSRWRCIESMQSALEGIDMRVEGKKLGANYVSDVALPLVLRMQLAQPIISGDDAADFCVAERMGFQAMWDNRRHGQWSTRRRHDSVMKTFGGAMNALVGPLKKAVFEKDAEFSRSCYVHGGKKHRPDMVLDNAMDDNVKFVFDLKNVAPCTRIGSDIVTVADHLRIAEENKRNSPAWKDFVPQDGMACEFVPFAIGWYGEMGREVKSFVRRVADHHIGDAYAKEWRIRRILAQVQVKHLNLIGVYLKTVRGEYERVGAAKKSNRGLPTLELNGWARGIDGDQYSSRVCHEGSRGAVLAISQSDELQIWSRSLDSRCDTTSGSGDISLSNKSGDVLNVEGDVCGALLVEY